MTRLRECRENARLSQKYVAVTLGVKAPSVSNWERGETQPTYENIVKLADLYNVSTDYLLGRSDEPNGTADGDNEIWELREQVRRDPERHLLFSLAKDADIEDVRQAVAILDALKSTRR